MESEKDILLNAIRNFNSIKERVGHALEMIDNRALSKRHLVGVYRLAKEYQGISAICRHVCQKCRREHAGITPCSGQNGRCHLKFRETLGRLASSLEIACFGRNSEFGEDGGDGK